MSGNAKVEVTSTLVPRHFTLDLQATLDGTAVTELLQVLDEWDPGVAGGLVGAIITAIVEANGGRMPELPQPVVVPDAPPEEEDEEDGPGGQPAVVGPRSKR